VLLKAQIWLCLDTGSEKEGTKLALFHYAINLLLLLLVVSWKIDLDEKIRFMCIVKDVCSGYMDKKE